jgi:hypothetical protein
MIKNFKNPYFILAVLFSVTVIFDFLIFIQALVYGTPIHPQLKQHFYMNPPVMLFLWYMFLKNK